MKLQNRPGGGGGSQRIQTPPDEGGGKKRANFCGCPLWMASYNVLNKMVKIWLLNILFLNFKVNILSTFFRWYISKVVKINIKIILFVEKKTCQLTFAVIVFLLHI